MRVGRGLYGLREWPDVPEAHVPPRRLNPLDEDILAVPTDDFLRLVSSSETAGLHDIDYISLLSKSKVVPRRSAETTEEFVQLIPSFVVLRGNEILSYKRTKKTPENRLHDTRTIVFGGHLQSEDVPTLFASEREVIDAFLFRELLEELALVPGFERYLYGGILHLRETAFERQHAGIVFFLETGKQTQARSLEPGYHSGLKFMPWDELVSSSVMDDRWSRVCITALRGGL
jgi:predicted NUDIX family phosphoesterase